MNELVPDVAWVAGADGRKPAQGDRKDQKGVDGHDEGRYRNDRHRQNTHNSVSHRAAFDRRPAAERNAKCNRPADSAQN